MQLYPWVILSPVQDNGHLGYEENIIQPLFPPRATAITAYPVT